MLEHVQSLEQSGNQFVNSILEATLSDSDRNKKMLGDRMTFIQQKYKDRHFFSEEVLHQKIAIRAKANRYTQLMRAPQQSRRDRLLNRPPSSRSLLAMAGAEESKQTAPARSQPPNTKLSVTRVKCIAGAEDETIDRHMDNRPRKKRSDHEGLCTGETVGMRKSSSSPALAMDTYEETDSGKDRWVERSSSKSGMLSYSKYMPSSSRKPSSKWGSLVRKGKHSRKSYNTVGSDDESEEEDDKQPSRKFQTGKGMPRSSSKPELSTRTKEKNRSSSSKWGLVKRSLRNKETTKDLLQSYNSTDDAEEPHGGEQRKRSSSSHATEARMVPPRSSSGPEVSQNGACKSAKQKRSSSSWGLVKNKLRNDLSRQTLLQSYSKDEDSTDSEDDRDSNRNSNTKSFKEEKRIASSRRFSSEAPKRSSSINDLRGVDVKETRREWKLSFDPEKFPSVTSENMQPTNTHLVGIGSPAMLLSKEERMLALLELSDNQMCAECNTPNPTWVSFFKSPVDGRQLGVFICFSCYGLHKKVGDGEFILKHVRHCHECKFSCPQWPCQLEMAASRNSFFAFCVKGRMTTLRLQNCAGIA
jgi:Putative GTPase activating protein for Arf